MSERAGHPSVDFVHFFDYLLLARARLFEWIRAQSSAAYTQTFSIGLGSIRATLLHVAASEWSYCQRLAGTDFAPGDIPFTVTSFPAFDALAAAWGEHGQTVRHTLARIADPSRTITYVSRAFSPPIRIEMTAGGIAGQLLFHEVHHRAQVMAMLRQLGVKAENLDYSVLMAKRTPAG